MREHGKPRSWTAGVVRQLALRGLHVLISARDPVAAKQAAASATNTEASGETEVLEIALDITADGSVLRAVDALSRSPGRIDVLVNNAAARASLRGGQGETRARRDIILRGSSPCRMTYPAGLATIHVAAVADLQVLLGAVCSVSTRLRARAANSVGRESAFGNPESLQAVVPQVRYVDCSTRIHGDSRWTLEFAGGHTSRSGFGKQLSIRRKLVQAIIAAIGDEHIPPCVQCNTRHLQELAVVRSVYPPLLQGLTC